MNIKINKLKIKEKIKNKYSKFTKVLDKFITKSKLAIPVFLLLLFLMFEITFTF
jgi:Fe2+ transport system protein B